MPFPAPVLLLPVWWPGPPLAPDILSVTQLGFPECLLTMAASAVIDNFLVCVTALSCLDECSRLSSVPPCHPISQAARVSFPSVHAWACPPACGHGARGQVRPLTWCPLRSSPLPSVCIPAAPMGLSCDSAGWSLCWPVPRAGRGA